jgi:hypothetical protein
MMKLCQRAQRKGVFVSEKLITTRDKTNDLTDGDTINIEALVKA